nr:hypothetical protein [Rhizobium cellulosilyticum]
MIGKLKATSVAHLAKVADGLS